MQADTKFSDTLLSMTGNVLKRILTYFYWTEYNDISMRLS